jgi:hypothetical protein
MVNKVIVKNSVVAGARPAASATNKPGELFVNVADKVIGTFDATGAPVELGSSYTLPAAKAAALGGVFATPAVADQFVTGIDATGALTHAVLPAPTASSRGGLMTSPAVAGQFVTGVSAAGTITRSALPTPSPAILGGVHSMAPVTMTNPTTRQTQMEVLTGLDTTGSFTHRQLTFNDIGGAVHAAQMATDTTAQAPFCDINYGANVQCTTLVETKMPYASARVNYMNCWDATKSIFKPSIAGYYFVICTVQVAWAGMAAGTTLRSQLRKNNTFYNDAIGFMADYQTMTCISIVSMNGVSDYLDVWGTHTNPGVQPLLGKGFTAFYIRGL